jgi:hypothetical protein
MDSHIDYSQSTICEYLTMFHRAVITDRLDNLEYMMTFKQGTPQLKVMSEIVRDQGTDINLIENCYRMFQCSTVHTEL